MREFIQKYGFPVFWVFVGAVNASAIWFGIYYSDNHRYGLIMDSIKQCKGSWELYGESSIFGTRVKCEIVNGG